MVHHPVSEIDHLYSSEPRGASLRYKGLQTEARAFVERSLLPAHTVPGPGSSGSSKSSSKGTPRPKASLNSPSKEGCLSPDSSRERCATEVPDASARSSSVMFLSQRARRILAPRPNSTRPTRSLAGLSPAAPNVSIGSLYHADNLLAQIFCHNAVRRAHLRARRAVGVHPDSVSA